MGVARSSFYAEPAPTGDDTALVEAMHAIKDEFEALWLAAYAGGAAWAGW